MVGQLFFGLFLWFHVDIGCFGCFVITMLWGPLMAVFWWGVSLLTLCELLGCVLVRHYLIYGLDEWRAGGLAGVSFIWVMWCLRDASVVLRRFVVFWLGVLIYF